MNQRIDGNGNIQAGRDVHIHGQPGPDPHNRNLMPCPACGRPVSVIADACPDCADNLAYRRRVAWEKEEQARQLRVLTWLGGTALAAFAVAQVFDAARTPGIIVAGLCVLLIAGVTKRK